MDNMGVRENESQKPLFPVHTYLFKGFQTQSHSVKPLFKPYNNSTDGFTIARVCVCVSVSVSVCTVRVCMTLGKAVRP